MRLDADYVRDILLFIEKELDYEDSESVTPHIHKEIRDVQLIKNNKFAKYDKQLLSYALEQMIKFDLIDLAEAPNLHGGNLHTARIIGLTWQGHELLDDIRDDTIWNAIKTKAAKCSGLSLKALFSAATSLGNSLLTDPNAIENFLQGIENIPKIFS